MTNSEHYITEEITEASDLTPPRLQTLFDLADDVRKRKVQGDIAEVGVYRGGSAMLLQSMFPDRDLWLFDTFAGNPEPGEWDREPLGSYACSLHRVQAFITGPRVRFVEGVFPNTFRPRADQVFAFVHLDCDQYESVKRASEAFKPLLAGVLVCDDYGYLGGAKRAFDEVFGSNVKGNGRQAWVYGDCV